METEAESGELIMFDNYGFLEAWLKSRCNHLWPSCGYCGKRFVKDEVTCASCGAPRGEG